MANVDPVVQAIAPVVGALGLDLYNIKITGAGRARVVRVLIDRAGGIDLEAIAAATEAISPVLDSPPVEAMLAGPYALEVSSPGLERPLRTPAHFAGATGDTISVKLRAGETPARRVRGVVQDAGATAFDLVLDDGSSERVDYGDVVQARTVFEWGPQPKRPKSKKTGSPKASARNAGSPKTTSLREPVRP
jgi:ribosome maturation factor RimP